MDERSFGGGEGIYHRGTETRRRQEEGMELEDHAFDSGFEDGDVEIDEEANVGLAETEVGK